MNLNLQTLNMLVGSTVQLLTEPNNEAYHCKFLGYANQESLMLSRPAIGMTPMVAGVGDEYVVRFTDGEKTIAFRSKVTAVCEHPFAYLHMEFPKGVQGTMLRRGQRYPVSQIQKPTLRLAMNDGENETRVQLTDISQSGACITALNRLGEIDDHFSIEMMVENKRISLPCKIRYVRKENHASAKTEYMHGVEFQQLNLDAQLFIDQFIQKHIQQQRVTH